MSRLHNLITQLFHSAELRNKYRGKVIKTTTAALILPIFYAGMPSASAVVVTATPSSTATVDSSACDQNISYAAGVRVTKIGNECVVEFTVPANYTWTVPYGVTKVDRLLVVGGGGAGGGRAGGGGGAGGYVYKTDVAVTPGANINLTVGAGAGETTYHGGNGGDSNFTVGTNQNLAKGGGGGGAGSADRIGYAGGSGGGSMGIGPSIGTALNAGAASNQTTAGNTGGLGNKGATGKGPLTTSEPQYSSGSYLSWLGGGGGGAGGAGEAATTTFVGTNLDSSTAVAGKGGKGIVNDITGKKVCYAAGGGGGGSQRATGEPFTYVLSASLPPASNIGKNGDYYINHDVNFMKLYKKTSGSWSLYEKNYLPNSGVPGGCDGVDENAKPFSPSGGVGGIGLWKGGYAVPNTGGGGGGGGWRAASPTTTDYTANGGAGGNGTVVIRYTIANTVSLQETTTGLAMLDLDPANYAGSGTSWRDVSGSGNNGTLVGNPSFTAASGRTPGYFTFNGTNQAVITTTQYPSPGPQTFSFAVWFKTDALGVAKIMGYENNQAVTGAVSYDRQLYVGNDHKLYWGLCDTTRSYCPRTVHTLNSVNDNQWHLAVATQSTVNGVATISLSLDNGAPYVSAVGGLAQIYSGYWKIGGYKSNGWPASTADGYFKGSIGRVTIYNSALNSDQAAKLFNQRYSATAVTAIPSATESGVIDLSWPAATGAASYTVKAYNATGTSLISPQPTIVVTGNSAKVSRLTAGTGYKFSVTTSGATNLHYYLESAKSSTVVAPGGACNPTRKVSGGYTILSFADPGTCQFTMDSVNSPVEYLVVGGGGGGGTNAGHGGQGGYYTAGTLDTAVINSKKLAISVGTGGAGGLKPTDNYLSTTLRNGIDGGDSSLTIEGASSNYLASGGAGGLTIWEHWGCLTTNFAYTQQGFPSVGTSVPGKVGLAGGAGGRASTGGSIAGGAGAAGYTAKAFGFNEVNFVSSGGGGGGWSAAGGAAGPGGGAGTDGSTSGKDATSRGSGGGAGGSNCMAGGKGASGVVILRYLNPLPKAAPTSLTLPVTGAYGHYVANNFNGLAKVWKDASGNNRDLTVIRGTPTLSINTAGTVNSSNDFYAVTGTPSDSISFGKMPTVNTIFHVARYNGPNKNRIFQNSYTPGEPGWNWLSGFWAGMNGMTYKNNWLTQYSQSAMQQDYWLVTADQHISDSSNLVRFNGIDKTVNPIGFNPSGAWGINSPDAYYNERSDFAVAEVIVYDRALSVDEIKQVEEYLTRKYVNQTGNLIGYLAGGGWKPDQLCSSGKVAVGIQYNSIPDYGMSLLKMNCGTVAADGVTISDTLSVTSSNPITTIGVDTGGAPKNLFCGPNQALTGLHFVQGGQPWGAAWGQKWPVGVRIQCAPLSNLSARTLDASTVGYPTTGYIQSYTTQYLSSRGQDDSEIHSGCLDGQAVLGFVSKAGGITDNMAVICGYPALSQPTIDTATATVNTLKSIDVNWNSISRASKYGIALYDDTGTALVGSFTVDSPTVSATIDSRTVTAMADNTWYKVAITAMGDGRTNANSVESTMVRVRTLAAPAIPTFSTQPSLSTNPGVNSGTVVQGSTITIIETSTAASESPTYQWQKLIKSIWTDIPVSSIPSARSQNLILSSVSETDTAQYRVVVTNTKYGVTTAPVASDTFTLTVFGIQTPKVGLVGVTGSSYSLPLRVFGGTGGTFSVATGTLNSGLVLNTSTGLIDTTTATEDTSTVQISYTLPSGLTDTTTIFTIKIVGTQLAASTSVVASPTSNTLKSIDLAWRNVDSATAYAVKMYDETNTALSTFNLDSVTRGSGETTTVTINASNYPDFVDNTTYKFAVIAMDGTLAKADSPETTKVSTKTLKPAQASTVETITVTAGTLTMTTGKSITFQAAGPFGEGNPIYQWQKNGSDIVGATSDSLTVSNLLTSDAGIYTVNVSYTRGGDTTEVTTSNALNLTVVQGISLITPINGLSASVGTPFSLQVKTATGTPNYTFSVAAGYSLPSWLTLNTSNGTLSGTPESATGVVGFKPIQITATDANASSDTTTPFTLVVSRYALDTPTATAAPTKETLKSIKITWAAIDHANRYIVRLYSSADVLLTSVSGISGTSYTLTNNDYTLLEDGAAYKISVVAGDSSGEYGNSPESSRVSVVTNPAPAVPVITSQPASVTKLKGQTFLETITVTSSNGNLTYQWMKNGAEIPDATNSSYTIASVSPADAGDYSVTVTNTFNGATVSTTSEVGTLTIGVSIATPTRGLTASTDTSTVFTLPIIAFGGVAPYTFEIVGTPPAGLSIDAKTGVISGQATAIESKVIQVKVTDSSGTPLTATTDTFTINVVTPAFAKVTNVAALPTPNKLKSINITWQKVSNAQNYLVKLWDASKTNVLATIATTETATGNAYTITTADYWNLENSGNYTVGVTAVSGAAADTANGLESDLVDVSTNPGPVAPLLTGLVLPVTGVVGASAELSVSASKSDSGVLTYQWFKGLDPIAGATNATLQFPSVATTDAASYKVKVTNSLNGGNSSVTSNNAALTVTSSIKINTPTAGLNATQSQRYALQVESSGGAGEVRYSIGIGYLPAGLTLDTMTALIYGTPESGTAGLGGTTYTITVVAKDATGTSVSTDPFKITVYVPQLATPTNVTAVPKTNALKAIDVSWTRVPNATSYNLFLYSSSGTVPLQTIDMQGVNEIPFTINIDNYPSMADGTAYKVSVIANADGTEFGGSLESVKASVTTATPGGTGGGGTGGGSSGGGATTPTPTPQTGPSIVIDPTQPFNTTVNVPGATNFIISGGRLPGGLALNSRTGVISGTVTEYGPYSFTVLATPPLPGTAVTYSGNIATPPPPPAPIVAPQLNIVPGAPFSYTPNVPGATNFQLNGGSLPAGVTLNPRTGQLSGTPTQPGPYSFSIVATPPAAGQVITFKGVIPDSNGSTTTNKNVVTDLGLNSLDPIAPVVAVKPSTNQNLFVVSSGTVGSIAINPNKSLTGLVVTSPDVNISVAGLTAAGQPLPLTSDNQLIVSTGLQFSTSGSGFLPNSELRIYMFSEPQLLATVKTDANGNWVAKLPVPTNLESGDHVLQVNGFLKSKDVKSVSIGVAVVDAASAENISKVFEQVIPFALKSSKVTTSSVALLKKLALQPGSVVNILGYTKKTGTSKDIAISLDRALEVKKALLKINPYLKISLSGQGAKINKKCSNLKNLCAVVTVKR